MENKPWNRAWNNSWNNRKSEHGRSKPDGGFCFIPAMALVRAWRAYKDEIIRLYDLRVWFACFELMARRCEVSPNRFPRYTFDEVFQLVGCGDLANVQTAVRRLTNAGLLEWSELRIRLPAVVVDDESICDAELWRMIDLVKNNRRKVPVPRRTVRFLAGLSKPVSIATVLGHLLRCMYYRNGMCIPDGRCKASWIADAFGVDVRNVKAARSHLRKIGWLIIDTANQIVLNRWGASVRVNLSWKHDRKCGHGESPPPAPPNTAELPPPRKNWELSSRMINQKPAQAARSGACRKYEKSADLTVVTLEDLRNPKRIESLFQQAQCRGWTPGGAAARLRFFAAAEHALRVGRRNPSGLFVSIIRRGLWAFIAAVDEDAARRRARHSDSACDAKPLRIRARITGRTSAPTPVRRVVHDVLRQFRIGDLVLPKEDVSLRGDKRVGEAREL